MTVKQSLVSAFPEDGLLLSGPIDLDLKIVNGGERVIVSGRLKTAINFECSRCLDQFEDKLNIEISEQFKQILTQDEIAREIELTEEDFVFPISEDNIIDLAEVIRQNLIASLPQKVLCRVDCPGIKSDILDKKRIDPRLEKLKEAL